MPKRGSRNTWSTRMAIAAGRERKLTAKIHPTNDAKTGRRGRLSATHDTRYTEKGNFFGYQREAKRES